MRRIVIYDTTLRDGAQTQGVSFSLNDKVRIVQKLDELGVDYIEGGFPGSNPKDIEFYLQMKKVKLSHAKLAAFSSTCHPQNKVKDDRVIEALLKTQTSVCTIFGKSWDLHVKDVLRILPPQNLDLIYDTVKYLKSKSKEVVYDAEHFFDGYKANKDYALKTLQAAITAGADCIVLCDTNGGTLPFEVEEIMRTVKNHCATPIGVHMHNDGELAVANSLVGIQCGAGHVQGTINGYGERCGNANLISIIPNITLKMGMDCYCAKHLSSLAEVALYVSEIANMKPFDNQPFVGAAAFAHKAGVHVDAVRKNPVSYEHIDPQKVGNARHFIASELSGKTAILVKAKQFNLKLEKDSPQTKQILQMLQDLEHEGYHFEAAEGSLELLMNRALGKVKEFFTLEGFKVLIENKEDKLLYSEAAVKLTVNGVTEHTVAEGDGPVNALDTSLRKALDPFYPSLRHMHLSDFKVRVMDEKTGTASKVRVLIQSHDETDSWWTVGVSENIIEASWRALVDSVEYKLMKDLSIAKKKRS